MKNKKVNIKLISYIMSIALLIFYILILSIFSSFGTPIKLPIRGFDPIDTLSGHYFSYNIDWNKVDCSIFPESKCPTQQFCSLRNCKFFIPEEIAQNIYKINNKCGQKYECEIVYIYNKYFNKIIKPYSKTFLINGIDYRKFKE